MESQYIKYFDPVESMGVNNSRAGFLPAGRYHGFDTWANPLITSTEELEWVDNTNTAQDSAVFVTKHGVVIFTDLDLDVTGYTWEDGKYGIVGWAMTWSDTPGALTITPFVKNVTDYEDFSSLLPTETPIGYLTYTTGPNTAYTPYDKPHLGGGEIDLSGLAKLAEDNKFTATNAWNVITLTEANLTDIGAGFYTIDLPLSATEQGEGNIIHLTFNNASPYANGEYKIAGIQYPQKADLSYIGQEGEPLYIMIQRVTVDPWKVSWASGEDIANGIAGFQGYNAYATIDYFNPAVSMFKFIRIGDDFRMVSAYTGMSAVIGALSSRVTANENEITILKNQDYQWVDLSTYTDVSTWTFEYLQKGTYNGLTYFRGKFTIPSGTRPPLTTLLSDDVISEITENVVLHCHVWDLEAKTYADVRITPAGGIGIHVPGSDAGSTMGNDVEVRFFGSDGVQ